MTKLPAILTLAVLAAFTFSTTANADDTPVTCAEGQVASGPYCVNPIYVNNPLFVDPATCEFGYFQGNCVPDTLRPPVEHPAADYTFQTPDTATANAPTAARPAEPIVEPVVTDWPTPAELESFDLRHGCR